ncbi:glycosyltransferase family 2 protein [Xanthobacter sediminis]
MISPLFPTISSSQMRERKAEVTLSICIPTYNRAAMLEYLLPQIKSWGEGWNFSFEVVVSDNHSTDNTADLVERFRAEGLPVHYFKQEENKRLSNRLSAFHRARGEYLICLAGDGHIIPEALADHIRFLQDNPDIRACYTPWEISGSADGKSGELSYQQPDELKIFGPADEADVIGYIVQHQIFPEIMIYRADAVRQLVAEPRFCHRVFTYLAAIAAKGPIAFRRVPYYRSVALTPAPQDGSQADGDDAMVDWDNYRGGLEFMVFSLLRRRNLVPTEEVRTSFRSLIDHFVEQRMRIALRLWLQRKDYVRVYEIICRLSYLDPSVVATFEHMDKLPLLVTAQILARLANGIAEIERLLVAGVDDGQALAQLLRDAGLERRILVIPPPTMPSPKNLRTSIVFIAREELRQSFLEQGYAPGLILSEQDIGSVVLV